jgi:hypothetical protein
MERELTAEQGFALIFEAHSARQLLGTGCHLLISSHGIDGKFDALATMWSIGVEKVLKVTLGLSSLASGDSWPNGKDFGHNLVKMDAQLWDELEAWERRQAQPAWVHELTQAVRDDPVWPPLLVVLDTYARSGRFAYLDRLAQVITPPVEPRPLWDAVESGALTARPDLRVITQRYPPAPPEEFQAALLEINRTVARSLARWWFAVSRAGVFEAYGTQGKRFSPELDPSMVLPVLPADLRKPA